MVKEIFQLGEKFYWRDHVEMFELKFLNAMHRIIPQDKIKDSFMNIWGPFVLLNRQQKRSDAYQWVYARNGRDVNALVRCLGEGQLGPDLRFIAPLALLAWRVLLFLTNTQ